MSLLDELKIKGWTEIKNVNSEKEFLNETRKIGQLLPHPNGEIIFNLRPSNGANSIKGTFSNRFGLNPFPLHTDTAFWETPARYIALSSINKSETSTQLLDMSNFFMNLSKNEHRIAERAIYITKTNQRQSYTSFLFKRNIDLGFRFDVSCMLPINNAAYSLNEILNSYIVSAKLIEYSWNGATAIVIDNWRVMHGRSKVRLNEIRELKRIYVN